MYDQEPLKRRCRNDGVLLEKDITGRHYLLNSPVSYNRQEMLQGIERLGAHTPRLYQFSIGFQDPDFLFLFAEEIMEKLGEADLLNIDKDEKRIGVILVAAIGGILIGSALQNRFYGRKPKLLYAEKIGGVLRLARGFKLPKDEGCLILDDVYSTGRSFDELGAICEYDLDAGPVLARVALVNRNAYGRPLLEHIVTQQHIFLIYDPIVSSDPNECFDCKERVPLEKDGVIVDNYGNPINGG